MWTFASWKHCIVLLGSNTTVRVKALPIRTVVPTPMANETMESLADKVGGGIAAAVGSMAAAVGKNMDLTGTQLGKRGRQDDGGVSSSADAAPVEAAVAPLSPGTNMVNMLKTAGAPDWAAVMCQCLISDSTTKVAQVKEEVNSFKHEVKQDLNNLEKKFEGELREVRKIAMDAKIMHASPVKLTAASSVGSPGGVSTAAGSAVSGGKVTTKPVALIGGFPKYSDHEEMVAIVKALGVSTSDPIIVDVYGPRQCSFVKIEFRTTPTMFAWIKKFNTCDPAKREGQMQDASPYKLWAKKDQDRAERQSDSKLTDLRKAIEASEAYKQSGVNNMRVVYGTKQVVILARKEIAHTRNPTIYWFKENLPPCMTDDVCKAIESNHELLQNNRWEL